jgi:putative molybdopterin biosynthesis protein
MNEPRLQSDLRRLRAAAGVSQSELAGSVGVSRQALIAIENGRQVPSTALALQLARALGCAVEDLFTLRSRHAIPATLAPGALGAGRVSMGRVDGVWAAHALPSEALPADGLVTGTAEIEVLVDPRRLSRNVLVAGCAPLIGVAAGRLGQRYRDARASWIPASSGRALAMLEEGLVHMAGLHLVDVDAPGGHVPLVRARFPERSHTVVGLTRWRQGIVTAPGNPLGIDSADDLLRPEVRFARRERGAGAQQLLERILAVSPDETGPWTRGPLAAGHAEVGRLVRWGVVDAGIAIESVALSEGLHFVPLAEERFDLVVPSARLELPHVARLVELLGQRAFRDEAARVPGYDVSAAGHAQTVEAV